jgi:hypothetical protein
MIPRFDRKHKQGGGTVRLGQESLVSAIGVAAFGHVGTHEAYIDPLRQYSADPFADIVEYLKRDIANLALGNPDNHGRNSAFSKQQNGAIHLSPLFDFAPMRLAKEGIVRSTRWPRCVTVVAIIFPIGSAFAANCCLNLQRRKRLQLRFTHLLGVCGLHQTWLKTWGRVLKGCR